MTRKQKWEEKQLYGCFKCLTSYTSYEKTRTWLRKGNLKKKTESLRWKHKTMLYKHTISKQKHMICNKTASIGYVVIGTK